ncbi:Expansin family protein [Mycena sanguinolenta]|uniref:Expansin family protein n=1 Tax=Mycena sanguinolenta TaxID=230812 RepID=A0A8H6Y6M2_9AGAR|nr:Expansin family protein [Mycena sanguinolenta]
MSRLASLALLALCLVSLPAITGAASITHGASARARELAKRRYTQPHSLGDSYTFDPRDGWQSFNATNLQYKYPREPIHSGKKKTSSPKLSLFDAVSRPISKALGMFGMKGTGTSEPVIVTWYTGRDLLHPSCWTNTDWAPTDASFVCALTLRGWLNKPQCFQFLEMCRNPLTCIFVRVVDSCAGCADASHHIDLTKGSFSTLADLDEGELTMNVREASRPDEWQVESKLLLRFHLTYPQV